MRIIYISFLYILSGCAQLHYQSVDEGKLEGKLIVEWIDADEFIFTPDIDKPLIFTRSSGEKIVPGKMYTDGGSIPRPLWALKSYSPWGYAPAFIVHDWLFEVKHCEYQGHEKWTVKEAALVMSEVMKTMMLDPRYGSSDAFTVYAMYKAVGSPLAKDLWDNGRCSPPPMGFDEDTLPKPKLRYVIEF